MNKQSATGALKLLTRFAAVCERIDAVVATYSAVGTWARNEKGAEAAMATFDGAPGRPLAWKQCQQQSRLFFFPGAMKTPEHPFAEVSGVQSGHGACNGASQPQTRASRRAPFPTPLSKKKKKKNATDAQQPAAHVPPAPAQLLSARVVAKVCVHQRRRGGAVDDGRQAAHLVRP